MAAPVTPLLTVDTVIRMQGHASRSIVLIERRNPPSGWALPGGFVDVGETVPAAAVREAREETALEVRLEHLLGVYSDPARDPRCHTVSLVFIGQAGGEPRAADDAQKIAVVDALDHGLRLAFDHRRILDDYFRFLESGGSAPFYR